VQTNVSFSHEPATVDRASLPALVVERAAAGSREDFTRLVMTYHADLVRLCFVITGDDELARDAAQSAWAHAWRKLRQLRDPERVRQWLLTVAANEARQALRRRRPVTSVPGDLFDPPGEERDASGLVDLAAALRRLRPDERRLIGLRYVSGFSSVELAEALGITPDGVRSRLKRILDQLREELRDA
jgi:RNA polymerase sigma-70 factor, ECF subfamily